MVVSKILGCAKIFKLPLTLVQSIISSPVSATPTLNSESRSKGSQAPLELLRKSPFKEHDLGISRYTSWVLYLVYNGVFLFGL